MNTTREYNRYPKRRARRLLGERWYCQTRTGGKFSVIAKSKEEAKEKLKREEVECGVELDWRTLFREPLPKIYGGTVK